MDGEGAVEKAVNRIAANRRLSLLALLVLCLTVYLPGVLRLPAVDRTEVVFAETTRDMLLRGSFNPKAFFDPRYGATVHQFRPIGTYWAQAKWAWLAGEDHARDITVYRLPGMLSVTLAVLALYWLAAPLVGSTAALIAAGLFAVAPLTVLVAHLAIAEGLSLLPATVAMLALLRIYTAPREEDTRSLGLVFWVALGLGMMINALLVPILVIATLIALRFMDRDMWWLQRLGIASGLPIAVLIASPWIIVRVLQDGVPFSGMDWREILAALGGSQDMKLRAMPGTFVLAALLGFLPGTALLAPAFVKLWNGRDAKIARFLLAWVVGYIVYLELLSSKPGTYMVQPMFPAFALAVGMLVAAWAENAPPKFHAIALPPLAALFAAALFAAPYAAVREWPAVWLWLPMVAVAGLFTWSAYEGRAGRLMRWAQTGIAALGLFAVTLIAGVFPSIDKIWPAREVQRALVSCPKVPIIEKIHGPQTIFSEIEAPLEVYGFNEPTSRFVLARDARVSKPAGLKNLANGPSSKSEPFANYNQMGYALIERHWLSKHPGAVSAEDLAKLSPIACVEAVNTMRGCTVSLIVLAGPASATCTPPARYACPADLKLQSTRAAPNSALKPCD